MTRHRLVKWVDRRGISVAESHERAMDKMKKQMVRMKISSYAAIVPKAIVAERGRYTLCLHFTALSLQILPETHTNPGNSLFGRRNQAINLSNK